MECGYRTWKWRAHRVCLGYIYMLLQIAIQSFFHASVPAKWHWFALFGACVVFVEVFGLVATLADGDNKVKVSLRVALHQHMTANNFILIVCVGTDSAAVNFSTMVVGNPLFPASCCRSVMYRAPHYIPHLVEIILQRLPFAFYDNDVTLCFPSPISMSNAKIAVARGRFERQQIVDYSLFQKTSP